MEKNNTYSYLLSLKSNDAKEQEFINTLKRQDNIKSYLLKTIAFYESKKKEGWEAEKMEKQDFKNFMDTVEAKLEKLGNTLDMIQKNTFL